MAAFFKTPDRVTLRNILQYQSGEHNHIDFKESWIEEEKLVKHILGMSNSGGGVLVFGIMQNPDNTFTPIGLELFKDQKEIRSKIGSYIPDNLVYEILDFDYEDSEWGALVGKKFQVIVIDDLPQYIPFLSKREGSGIKKNRIYYRSDTESKEATHEQVQEIINRRIDTSYSTTAEDTFKNDLLQLRELYDQISRSLIKYSPLIQLPWLLRHEQNPDYPEESFEDFIKRMIEKKKQIIENSVSNRSN